MNKMMTMAFLMIFSSSAFAQSGYSLKECIDYGLKHHGSQRVYQNKKQQADEMAREALSDYLPQVNGTATLDDNLKLQTNIIPAGAFSPTETKIQFGTPYNSGFVVQLDQPIYNQAYLIGIKAAKPNQDIADLNIQQNTQDIIYNIANSYYRVIVSQKQLALYTDNKARFERLLRIANLQAEQGTVKKVDVKQVQVNLNNVLSQISVAENNYNLSLNTLKNYMGLKQDEQVYLTDTARWLESNVQESSGSKADFAYEKTIEYKLQKSQIMLYDLQQRRVRAGNLPVLSGYARYGANGFGTVLHEAYDRMFDYSAIGLKLTLNLFDGFRRNAQYKQALYDLYNARENLTLNQMSKELAFDNAIVVMERNKSTTATNKSNMELASEVYENVTTQFKLGASSLTELLNAESSYRDAQNNYLQSLLNFYISQLDVERTKATLDTYAQSL
jgi:outer membrane protein TolC